MIARCEEQVRNDTRAVQEYTWERIGDHPGVEQRETVAIYQAARLLNSRFVKQHQLSLADVGLLSDPFPFITEEVISKLVAEKDEYHLAASGFDTDYDLWEFWRDSETRFPRSCEGHRIDSATLCLHGTGLFYSACLHEREAEVELQRPHCSVRSSQQRAGRIGVRRAGETGKRCHGVCFVFFFWLSTFYLVCVRSFNIKISTFEHWGGGARCGDDAAMLITKGK